MICRDCAAAGGVGCDHPPGPHDPIDVGCPNCRGAGCPECDDLGRWELAQCPLEYVDGEIWELIELANLFRKGLAPISGGVLDQAAGFVAAAQLVWSETALRKAQQDPFNLSDE